MMTEELIGGALRAVTLRRRVADALRQAILSGELRPGERLREVDLAKRFGVSRNPVREAVGELEQQGLIVSRPNQGKSVVSPTEQELRDALQVRLALERLALQQAWPALTPARLSALRRLVDEMRRVSEDAALTPRQRHGRLNIMDARFHGLLVEWSGNQTLMRAWHASSAWCLGFIHDLEDDAGGLALENGGEEPHEALLAALESGVLESALEALSAHFIARES